jgi:glycosyltransferase involved in cell wall biosynthesis
LLRKVKGHRLWVENYGIKICNSIDLHLGVSKKTLKYLESYNQIQVKSSYVLYNGVDTKKFYQIPNIKYSNYFTIGCVGNFWPLKDQITLLKALKILIEKHIEIRCKFIGSGITLKNCQAFVVQNELSEYVTFYPEMSHQEINNFYNSLNLFVLPSYYEAFGCVYTEAYACGIPFIAVEGQGVVELISEKDKSKWLIVKEDYKNLATKIEDFKIHKYKQVLNESIDITYFISNFLIHINKQ